LVSALVAKLTRPEARSLVGSGWEDITRVAAGDPSLWTAICQENRQAIGRELARYAEELSRLCRILDTEDDERLWSWLAEAKRVKEQSP
jgi:prephenate dehydrogenase